MSGSERQLCEPEMDTSQDYFNDDIWWSEQPSHVEPWIADDCAQHSIIDQWEPSYRQPIDIPPLPDRSHVNNPISLQAYPILDEVDAAWTDDTALSLYIENGLLSELPHPDVADFEHSPGHNDQQNWASHTGWMSGQNTFPTFSYIQATFSNPQNHNDSKKRKRTNFEDSQTQTLRDWLDLHKDNPYPTEDELLNLCTSTGLELKQVRNWFARTRQRKLARHNSSTYKGPWAAAGRQQASQATGTASLTSRDDSAPSSITALLSLNVRPGSSLPADNESESEFSDFEPTPSTLNTSYVSEVKLHLHDSKLEWWLESVRSDIPLQLQYPTETANFPFDAVFDPIHEPVESLTFTLDTTDSITASVSVQPTQKFSSLSEGNEDRTEIPQKLRTHIGYLLRRGRDSAFLTTPDSSNSSLQSLLRHARRRAMTSQSGGPSPSPSVEEMSDNGRSLFSHQSFGSKISVRSAATSFSFGSRKGRKPQYWSGTDLHEKMTDASIEQSEIISPVVNKNRCRFCKKIFSRFSSVVRHEKALHAPDSWWVCGNDGASNGQTCHVCLQTGSGQSRECTHEFWKCNSKPLNDRVFLRRDNFQDHLRRVHNVTRSQRADLDLSIWKHDQGDLTAILDAQKKSRDFRDGLKQLDLIPAIPKEWGVVLKDALEEEVYEAEDVAMELDRQRLPRIPSAHTAGKFSFRSVQCGTRGIESNQHGW